MDTHARSSPADTIKTPLVIAHGLKTTLGAGYGAADLRQDILAGLVVGIVALPLSMALAIATGVPPQFGIYTAIVAGAVIALLGGSAVQISGPTAAFVVILAPISAKFGLAGLALATLFAGVILIVMGLARLGKLIEFVPYPVTSGFTAGIAIVIATLQLKDFFGLTVAKMPDHYLERIHALWQAAPTVRLGDTLVGAATLGILLLWPKVTRKLPAPLVALPLAALGAWVVSLIWPGFQVETIATRFGGIPQTPPIPQWPWQYDGPNGQPLQLSYDVIRPLLVSSFAIAMLGAIESLLTAVIADGMTGRKHDPDGELIAQGAGNILAPFFGGFAATGAIARTATSIRAGARSPISAIVHALFILAAVLVLAPILGYLPMAALAALLLLVAWNMSEVKHVLYLLRVSPPSDKAVLLVCLALTVLFDMVISVSVGVVLAALLFMRRMADLTGARLIEERHPQLAEPLPPGVLIYEVAGPLFFGAAQQAMSALRTVGGGGVTAVVLDLRSVPTMDATGLVSLEATLQKLHDANIFTIIGGVQMEPLKLMARAGWKHRPWLAIYRNFDEAIDVARSFASLILPPQPPSAKPPAQATS